MEFRKMKLSDIENILEVIDEIFGTVPTNYSPKENLLMFENPILIEENGVVHLLGVGVTEENMVLYKMYNTEKGFSFFTDGFEF